MMADERDPKVSKRYRELGGEEPPHELDQTILAAAHRAADRAHAPLVTPAGRHRWYFSLAAAAILVLAVAVTVQVERQQPDPEAVTVIPAPPAGEGDFFYKGKEAPPPAVEQRRDARPAEPPRKQLDRRKPKPGVTADPAPAPSPPAESAVQPRESREQAAAADAAAEPAPAPQAAPAPEMKAREGRVAAAAVPPLTPERLLERIAELRREGRHKEADQALAEFRERYPDYRISGDMLQKVERKK